jgi:hypothetical protein
MKNHKSQPEQEQEQLTKALKLKNSEKENKALKQFSNKLDSINENQKIVTKS